VCNCRKLCLLWVIALLCLPGAAATSSDPVTKFIFEADSLAKTGGDAFLGACVAAHPVLVGAAVGQLLDAAFEAGQTGDATAESENVDLAGRIATLHLEKTGSAIPLEIVEIYRRWTSEQKALHAKVKTLEAEALTRQNDGDYDGATELYRQVIELSQSIDDRRMVAVTWGSLGVVNWYRNDMAAVQENYEKALAARRAIEDRILEGKTLNGLGSVALRLGKYEQAVQWYSEAAKRRRETGDLAGLGTSLTYKGHAYYQIGRLVDARKSYEEAYAVLERYGTPAQMIEVLNGIANIHTAMGRLSSATDTYRRAIDIASTVDRPKDEATCRVNLAGNLRAQGRYREALDELDHVSALLDRQPEPETRVLFFRERGQTYREMGELDQARDDLLVCLEQAKKLDAPYFQIEALTTLGNLYADLGAYDRGLEMAMQADTLAGRIGSDPLLVDAYVLAANMEQSLGHPAAALQYRERSREKNEKQGAETAVLYDDVAIASFRAMLGQEEEARELFYKTLPQVRELNAQDLEEAVHFGIGHTYEKENPDSAAFHYEKALSLIEESRAQIGGAETRTGFFSGARRFYYEEVARYYASLETGKKSGKWSSRAFQTIERAKARGLLELLERAVSVEPSAGEDAIVDSLYLVAGDSPGDNVTKRRIEKRYLEMRDERLTATVGRLDPRGSVVTLDDVQKQLSRRTALLEYALGDTCSLLWVVDRDGFDVFVLPNRGTLRVDVERFRDAIQKPGAGDTALRETAASLYDWLLRPAERRLARAERLVIVPDGFLFEVPFDALLTNKTSSETDWRDLPYLARSFETVYSPSASIFSKMSKTRKKGKYGVELLAFGDPDFSRFSRGPAVGLAELPYSRSEVERIGSFLGEAKKRIYLGADASESHLKSTVRSGRVPRILHFATHGLVDRAEPEASSVVLAPDTSAGEDGYLHALEIMSLPLDAGLVVLSACESAQGQVGRGEGVVGLSRAFIASGSRGVVASLWAVSDESTSELMATFYAEMLGSKRPASEALRAARLSLIENPERAHPFYWSPFVVIGTGKAPW